jgi:hypothetical protein
MDVDLSAVFTAVVEKEPAELLSPYHDINT